MGSDRWKLSVLQISWSCTPLLDCDTMSGRPASLGLAICIWSIKAVTALALLKFFRPHNGACLLVLPRPFWNRDPATTAHINMRNTYTAIRCQSHYVPLNTVSQSYKCKSHALRIHITCVSVKRSPGPITISRDSTGFHRMPPFPGPVGIIPKTARGSTGLYCLAR